jgi:hypothetical protein
LLNSPPADFFPVQQAEIHLEMMKVWHRRRDTRVFAERPEGNTETKCSRTASKSGRNVGGSVLVVGGSALRVRCK